MTKVIVGILIRTITLGAAALVCTSVSAENLRLLCVGTMPVYENGFGTTTINWDLKTERLFEIDFTKSTVTLLTLFGERVAPLQKNVDSEKYIHFTVAHNVMHQGVKVIDEKVLVDRYTGAVNSLYSTEPKSRQGGGYVAFTGSCTKAEKRF